MTVRTITPAQRRIALRAQAMPEVKKLVRKFGRATIAACIAKIRAHEKGMEELATLKRKIVELSRRK